MAKKNKIKYLLIALILSFSFVSSVKAVSNNNDKILLIDDISTWAYIDGSWYNTTFEDGNNSYRVYTDNKYLGTYKIKKSSEFTLYDNSGKNISYSGDLFAYSDSLDIRVRSYTKGKIVDSNLSEINTILNSSFKKSDFSVNERIVIDLDNNGVNDEIINVSNLDAQTEQSKYFDLMYININNKNRQVLINKNVIPANVLIEPIYQIKYILKVDEKYNGIIVEEGYFSEAGKTNNLLYTNTDGTYKKISMQTIANNGDNTTTNRTDDYSMYILAGVLLIIMLIAYAIISIVKNRDDDMDDD